MGNIFSFLSASVYAGFSPLLSAISSTCTVNGKIVDCPAWLGNMYGITLLASLALIALMIVAQWKIFVKAGQPGWAAIIPIYNTIILLKIAQKPLWWILLMLIPFVNIIISFIVVYNLAKAFGKGGGFTIGLILLPIVFYPILAFGDATYQPAAANSQSSSTPTAPPAMPGNQPNQPTGTQM